MFYVFQMQGGRWQVDAFTNAPDSARRMAWLAPSFETKAEAEQWMRDAKARWADVAATARTLEEIFDHLPPVTA